MSVGGYENGHHGGSGFLPGARSRHLRTMVVAGVLLLMIWTIKKSPLFREHYESGFTLINPDKVPTATDIPKPQAHPPPIALPGDSFYLTDALHKALNPNPASPPAAPLPPPPTYPDSAAVIIETDPSKIPNLTTLILHFATVLGPTWPIILLTQRSNWIEPASPAFRRMMHAQRVRIHFLPEPYATTGFPSHSSVSVFLTQPWLWEHFVEADRLLLFQADSILCGNSGSRVEDFGAWDLVGAPVAEQYGVGFNGGLSLRNPRAMLAAIAEAPVSFEEGLRAWDVQVAKAREEGGEEAARAMNARTPSWEKFEDQWFWWRLNEMNKAAVAGISQGEGEPQPKYKVPSVEVARGFSVETIWEEKPLGYHQPFRWLSAAQQEKALEWCPELGLLGKKSHFF